MSLVLDTSIVATWVLTDQGTPSTWSLLLHVEENSAYAPWLLKYEVAHVVTRAVKSQIITMGEASAFFGVLNDLPIFYDELGVDRVYTDAALLAIDLDLSAYDAVFLELAIRAGLPLATRDRALAAGARTMGVEVLGAG